MGRKNSGKTTLMVALVAELVRRGRRVATIKHGHHDFESDHPGRDSWRHFHEGGAEASIMCGTGKVALTQRIAGEPDPEALVRRFYAGVGLDLVLVEGFKHGTLPKIEVYRRALHDQPIFRAAADGAPLALVTDAPDAVSPAPRRILMHPGGTHVADVADLVERWMSDRAG